MIIKLSPVRSDEQLSVTKQGDTLVINGVSLDLSRVLAGGSLPAAAIGSPWVGAAVERISGDLLVTLLLPHAAEAPEDVRFPSDITNPSDGPIRLPTGIGDPVSSVTPGIIDWSQLVTAEMKAEAAAAQVLAAAQAEAMVRRTAADLAIAPLKDAVDLDEATEAEVELLKDWKRYRVALNRLPDQPGYPTEIDWPAPPA